MTARTVDDGMEYHYTLMSVIERKPKLFAKWSDLKFKFSKRNKDDRAEKPVFTIHDAIGER